MVFFGVQKMQISAMGDMGMKYDQETML